MGRLLWLITVSLLKMCLNMPTQSGERLLEATSRMTSTGGNASDRNFLSGHFAALLFVVSLGATLRIHELFKTE
jgi:hypothetical protein